MFVCAVLIKLFIAIMGIEEGTTGIKSSRQKNIAA